MSATTNTCASCAGRGFVSVGAGENFATYPCTQCPRICPLPEGCDKDTATKELEAYETSHFEAADLLRELEYETDTHRDVVLDWASQVRAMGFTWKEALLVSRVWYFG